MGHYVFARGNASRTTEWNVPQMPSPPAWTIPLVSSPPVGTFAFFGSGRYCWNGRFWEPANSPPEDMPLVSSAWDTADSLPQRSARHTAIAPPNTEPDPLPGDLADEGDCACEPCRESLAGCYAGPCEHAYQSFRNGKALCTATWDEYDWKEVPAVENTDTVEIALPIIDDPAFTLFEELRTSQPTPSKETRPMLKKFFVAILMLVSVTAYHYARNTYDALVNGPAGATSESGRALTDSLRKDTDWRTAVDGKLANARLQLYITKGSFRADVIDGDNGKAIRGFTAADLAKLNDVFDGAYAAAEKREVDARLKVLHDKGPADKSKTTELVRE